MNTTANKITVLRIILVPVFMVLLYLGQTYWALAVYIIACVSDFVDGKIARKYNQITDFGKFMDPLADKMLVLAAMCYFVEVGLIPGWVVAVVLLREFGVSGLRLLAGHRDSRRVVRQDKDRRDHGGSRRSYPCRTAVVPRTGSYRGSLLDAHTHHHAVLGHRIFCEKHRRI